ncbi:MAG TPA: hypothetical protein ENK47_00915 [Euryarchaeota archaeon]|nr:MAG: hypothetical protein B6U90_05225 [Thermoplasmatales archaeon ex4484_6]RLF68851.1 MAG: hypothetical protein DRN57_02665 [Thermoplasmata archaeon]HHD15250.1 hypothetical protein [Euryarchaeota archaeon]
MKISTRIQAISVTHPLSMNRKLDQYLSEHLPDLMDEYKIADRTDIHDLDRKFEGYEKRMDDLELWRTEFDQRLSTDRTRMDRLKVKYGVK